MSGNYHCIEPLFEWGSCSNCLARDGSASWHRGREEEGADLRVGAAGGALLGSGQSELGGVRRGHALEHLAHPPRRPERMLHRCTPCRKTCLSASRSREEGGGGGVGGCHGTVKVHT